MSAFFEAVERARRLLEDRGRVSLRGLRRDLEIDEETLDDLAEELVEGLQVARREGAALVWRSDAQARVVSGVRVAAHESERRQLVVVFCDMVGSTELAQRIDPEELRQVLHDYREVCVEAVEHFGGHVAQYLGDGVLVYFGYPRALEDQADRAIRCALEIQRQLGERQLDARIGIHSGLVVVDPEAEGEDALALGPTVNVAARIQGIAHSGSVVVSDETLSLCRSSFQARSLGETPVRGLDHPMVLHEVERVVGAQALSDVDDGRPMLGRDRELAFLLDRWSDLVAHRGHVVLVRGEPGIGKSRLIRSFRDALGDRDCLWLTTQCSPFAQGSAFQPIVDLLVSQFGIADLEPAAATERIVERVSAIPGLDDVIPYLLALLGLPSTPDHPPPQITPDEQRERTLSSLVRLNSAVAQQRPLVIVAEDLHWADPSTLEYVGRLAEAVEASPVLIALTCRPEFRPAWSNDRISEISLARLSAEATRELIHNSMGRTLPATAVAELERRSDGVPLYIEELVAGLMSTLDLGDPGRVDESDVQIRALSIPASLQDALMARLDRLGASKRVAQQAAIIGREFSHALIAAVVELDPQTLERALDQLVDAQILHRSGRPPHASYSFRHALIQATAYESQLRSSRKTSHARVAAVLEEHFPRRVEVEPELMARHCAAGDLHDAAVGHSVRAAELAKSRFANEEASEHFRLALEALGQLPESDERNQQEIGIRIAHGQALVALLGSEVPQVRSNYSRIEALCDALEEGLAQVPALIALAEFEMVAGGDPRAGSAYAERVAALGRRFDVPQLLVAGNVIIASAALAGLDVREAEPLLRELLEIAKTVPFPPPVTPYDTDVVALAYGVHVLAIAGMGKPDQAMAATAPMEAYLQTLDHPHSHGLALASVVGAGYVLLDADLCEQTGNRILALLEGNGFHTTESVALVLRGWGRAQLGEIDRAVADVERGLAVQASLGYMAAGGYYQVAAADVHRLAKNHDRARELLEVAAAGAGRYEVVAMTRSYVLGMLELEDGRLDTAEQHLEQAYALAATSENRWQQLHYATQLARVAARTGDVGEARERLEESYGEIHEGLERRVPREAKTMLDALARS